MFSCKERKRVQAHAGSSKKKYTCKTQACHNILMSTNTKEYGKQWYEKNKEKRVAQIRAYQRRERDKLQEYKSTLSCQDCGESDPVCLDFHHLDSKTKEYDVSRMTWGTPFEKIKKEIEKCIVLCANCHRKRHSWV